MSPNIEGKLWLLGEGNSKVASEQIELLKAIAETGSISAAAKSVGISYKTAWDRIEALNNISPSTLVERSAGGSRGGGTRVTEYAMNIIAGFTELEKQHHGFLAGINRQIKSMDDVAQFMKTSLLKSSARNQFSGTIKSIEDGAVNCEIQIDLGQGNSIVAVITEHSREDLELIVGSRVLALIKASQITISPDAGIRVSARNKLLGNIIRLTTGAVNSEISLDLGDEKTLTATLTNTSVDLLQLEQGQKVCAFFKASAVIIMLG